MKQALFKFSKTKLGELIVGIAFGKFAGLLPVEKVRETDKVIAFVHPKPHWEHHILIVPKKAIKSLADVQADELSYINEVFTIAQEIVRDNGWQETDYTLITNGGSRQEVAQLHFHLASGSVRKR